MRWHCQTESSHPPLESARVRPMDPKFRAFAEKLRSEAEKFADYKTIERKTTELGFPTSVRTLRFYVSEGVLPAPRKHGKASVYPEEWILNTLLAIHLMKTRFSRGLAEIKAILQGLSEDPEVLADKLTELYDLCYDDGSQRLSSAEQKWIVERFFGALSGRQPLEGRPRGQGAQPGEVLLTDLFKALDDRTEADIADGERQPPGRTRQEARRLEGLFMRAFESKVRSLERIYDPVGGSSVAVRGGQLQPLIGDAYQAVARMLVEHRLFDRDMFDSMPLNKSSRFDITEGLLERKTRLSIVGVSWSPLEDLVTSGRSDQALTPRNLQELVERFSGPAGSFTYLGVLGTCGLTEEARSQIRFGETLGLALIEHDEVSGWKVHHSFPQEALPLESLFDPEPPSGKADRLARRLLGLDALRVRGGFVELEELEREWDVSPAILDAATRKVVRADPQLEVITVDNRRILKRARHVV